MLDSSKPHRRRFHISEENAWKASVPLQQRVFTLTWNFMSLQTSVLFNTCLRMDAFELTDWNLTLRESYCEAVPEATCSTLTSEIESHIFIFEIITICLLVFIYVCLEKPLISPRISHASPPLHTWGSQVALGLLTTRSLRFQRHITRLWSGFPVSAPAVNPLHLTRRQVWPDNRGQDALIIVLVL